MNKETTTIGLMPPHPGAFLRQEVLEELELSISAAADLLDVRRATLSDLVNEKTSLSPEMALRVEIAFGIKTAMLLRMQAWYDSETIRSKAEGLNVQRYIPQP